MKYEVIGKENGHYRVTKDGQWSAYVMLDDELGPISIHSDWGDWWFIWTQGGRGTKTLREFLIDCDTSYLCTKFMHTYYQIGASRKTMDNVESRLLRFLAGDWPALKECWIKELNDEQKGEDYPAHDGGP